MSNNKQVSFDYHLPNDLVLEVNAKVDTRTEDEIYGEVMKVLHGEPLLVRTVEHPANKTIDVNIFIPAILKDKIGPYQKALESLPVKTYYLSNNERLYVEYDITKFIQTVFYQSFPVKELLLEVAPALITSIARMAIEESKKETINQ